MVVDSSLPSNHPSIPDGWSYVVLGDLVDQERGISYGVVQPGKDVLGGIPIVRVNDIQQNQIALQNPMRIDPAIEAQYLRTRLRGGEVLLSLVGSLGQSAIAPEALLGWNTARAVGVIPVLPDPGPRWVELCLRSPLAQRLMSTWATTTVQATLNLRDVRRLPIPLPPQKEREAVSRVLGALDDKIELNRRMNETLEAIAQTTFKSWFVDFDPVRAKAAGSEPDLVAPEIVAFFPFSLALNRDIPNGWSVSPFTQLVDISREAVVPGDHPNEVFAHYSIPAFDEGEMPIMECGEAIKSNKFLVQSGSVLLSKLNPRIPRVWKPKLPADVRAICSTEYLVLRPRTGFHSEYVYCLCTSTAFQEEFVTMVTGTSGSHQRVKPEYLDSTEVVLPPECLIDAFAAIVRPMLDRVDLNLEESVTLSSLRDTLLPKLLSGEIRLKEAETAVEEAV